jgi:hypothetical protein
MASIPSPAILSKALDGSGMALVVKVRFPLIPVRRSAPIDVPMSMLSGIVGSAGAVRE